MDNLKTLLRTISGGPEVLPEGQQWCPGCKKLYVPDFLLLEECPQEDKVAREQHLSGTCSQECWDAVTQEE